MKVRVDSTGDGYKAVQAKVGYTEVDVEVYTRPDGRRILSFGYPWEYQLGGEFGIDVMADRSKPLCIDMGAGLIIPAEEMARVWAFVDQQVTP